MLETLIRCTVLKKFSFLCFFNITLGAKPRQLVFPPILDLLETLITCTVLKKISSLCFFNITLGAKAAVLFFFLATLSLKVLEPVRFLYGQFQS